MANVDEQLESILYSLQIIRGYKIAPDDVQKSVSHGLEHIDNQLDALATMVQETENR
jgi:hypothetical protein